MALSREYLVELESLWNDDQRFLDLLRIEDLRNQVRPLAPLWPEQLTWLDLLARFRRVLAIKPRQVGLTTITMLFLFAKTYRSPHPRQVLQTVHDKATRIRLRRMLDVAYRELPRPLRGGLSVSNKDQTEFAHNRASFYRVIAGERGQGRGGTYSDYHATEMAFYPEGSSALKDAEEAADSDLFASIQAALHDPEGHVIVESTGNGPRGLFWRMVRDAIEGRSPETGFLFIPWSAIDRYRRLVPEGFEPTDEERALMAGSGLDLEQIAWRRHVMTEKKYTPTRFKREYPLTELEPFLLEHSVWFDGVALNNFLTLGGVRTVEARQGEQIYEQAQFGRRYFASLDTAGGVRGDEGSICVGDDRGVEVARWDSDSTSVRGQVEQLARFSTLYPGLLILIERNKFGVQALEYAVELGLNLWTDDEGRFFWSNGEGGGNRKRAMMLHAQELVNSMQCCPRDPKEILQLQSIVEKPDGRIEARGEGHDDRAISFCLMLWCARGRGPWERGPVDLDALRRKAQFEFGSSNPKKRWG